MKDLTGLIFFAVLLIAAFFGLRALSKPRKTTAEEFERAAARNSTALGAISNALQEAIDPAAAKSKEVIAQMKDGRYKKKAGEGELDD